MTGILDKIAVNKRIEIDEMKIERPLESFVERISADQPPGFGAVLEKTDRINIIAELKKGSPSRGIIREDFNPIELARKYRDGGAAALSVLTEQRYFYGRFEYLKSAKAESNLPILCKDFIIDPYQIYYAKYMGADAVLLIVRMLGPAQLTKFIRLCEQTGLDALVETHNEAELTTALDCGARIVGVNNRDLDSFDVDINTAVRLAKSIPDDITRVAESGISDRGNIEFLQDAGYSNFLIGEALMKSDDPAELIRRLREE